MNKKIIGIIISLLIIVLTICWFLFDFNSRIDILRHPEKYSFNIAMASNILDEDYLFAMKIKNSNSMYDMSKIIENKFSNKSDERSQKIISLNNKFLDLYHDVLSKKKINKTDCFLSNDEYIFLFNNEKWLFSLYNTFSIFYPQIEPFNILENEVNIRKEVVKQIKQDLIKRNINAKIKIDDIEFESISPVYIDAKEKPHYINDFHIEFIKLNENFRETVESKYDKNKIDTIKNNIDENNIDFARQIDNEYRNEFWDRVNKIEDKWKYRYLIKAVEIRKDGTNKVHLYKANRYKDGNRYYWNIEYYSPESEFLNKYMQIIEMLSSF